MMINLIANRHNHNLNLANTKLWSTVTFQKNICFTFRQNHAVQVNNCKFYLYYIFYKHNRTISSVKNKKLTNNILGIHFFKGSYFFLSSPVHEYP